MREGHPSDLPPNGSLPDTSRADTAQPGEPEVDALKTGSSPIGTTPAVSQHDPSEDGEPSPLSAEPLTDELLEHLLASATPDAFLAEAQLVDRSLSEYLHLLLQDKGLTRGEVIRASGLNATFAYQCFQGTRKPGRDHAIMLAFGLCCTRTETQRLLRYAGHAELWCKLRRDAIIIYSVEHGHTRAQCDDELYRLGEDTLLPAG